MVTACVAVVTVGVVAPGLQNVMARQRLVGAAGEFESDMQFARSTAVTANRAVRVAFGGRAGQPSACYVVFVGALNDCGCGADGTPVCQSGVQPMRHAAFDPAAGFTLSSNVRSIVFDPLRGTSTPAATVRFVAADGRALHQVVNVMGRVRSCSPPPSLSGFKAC